MTDREYENLAQKIGHDMLNYKTKYKSFTQVYNLILNKYLKSSTTKQENIILIKTIHYITLLGYDIDIIKPCRFKKYKY
ncbi:MAG: hypothetical protein IKF19_04410 [Bacilli bacterium]|nr:hypothetical protein [Bacilli bacterium]